MNSIKKSKGVLVEAHYLPNVQYFSKLVQCPVLILEAYENYQKGSYRNRCHIAGANGLMRLSIPLRKGKNEQLSIRQTEISYDEPWINQHWQSIKSAYGNAPYFPYYQDEIADLFQQRPKFLFDWNKSLLQLLVDLLQLQVEVRLSEGFSKAVTDEIYDLRGHIHPKSHRQQVDHNFQAVPYPQLFEERHGFLPNLSILDLLFCTGPQAVLYLEESFKSGD
ncbi:MAG: WbqC family protein [Saprospiraceae bacterium]|nr:WbqC family protein [Saprospiraceae bacterium]